MPRHGLVVFIDETWKEFERAYGRLGSWKIAALFFGARDETGTIDPLNPNSLRRAGFSAARNILVEGMPVKLPTQYSMIGADKSPLRYDGRVLIDELSGRIAQATDFPLAIPPSIENLLPTATGIVGVMSYAGCELYDKGRSCEFCTLGGTSGKEPLSEKKLLSELEELVATGYRMRGVTINTGQMPQFRDELKVVADLTKVIKREYAVRVAAEISPFGFPPDPAELGLEDVDTFMVNVELVDDRARKELCPGKPSIRRYKEILFSLADRGYEATSVLQLNFYPEREPIEGVKEFVGEMMGRKGLTPEFLISRAVPGSRVRDAYWKALATATTDEALPLMALRFRLFADRLLQLPLVGSDASAGCVACGMCNLNSLGYARTGLGD